MKRKKISRTLWLWYFTARLHLLSTPDTIGLMHLWDYREKELKKTAWGRRYILQNMINLGPGRRKISKKLIKKYWFDLDIDPIRRNLLRYLIWGKR